MSRSSGAISVAVSLFMNLSLNAFTEASCQSWPCGELL